MTITKFSLNIIPASVHRVNPEPGRPRIVDFDFCLSYHVPVDKDPTLLHDYDRRNWYLNRSRSITRSPHNPTIFRSVVNAEYAPVLVVPEDRSLIMRKMPDTNPRSLPVLNSALLKTSYGQPVFIGSHCTTAFHSTLN